MFLTPTARERYIAAARSMFETFAPYGLNVDATLAHFVRSLDAPREPIDPELLHADGFFRDNA